MKQEDTRPHKALAAVAALDLDTAQDLDVATVYAAFVDTGSTAGATPTDFSPAQIAAMRERLHRVGPIIRQLLEDYVANTFAYTPLMAVELAVLPGRIAIRGTPETTMLFDAILRLWNAPPKTFIRCPIDGLVFVRYRRQKFCSRRCAAKDYLARHQPPPPSPRARRRRR